MAALFRDSTMNTNVFLLLLAAIACRLAQCDPNPVEELQVETLVKPETCSVLSTMGDSLRIHYTISSVFLGEDGAVQHVSSHRSQQWDSTPVEPVKLSELDYGKLMDGKVFDSSLSRDTLLVELGKRTVIAGLEQSLIGVCEGQKLKATIPPHLAYGKKGYPPTIPGDAVLEFEVEVVSLMPQTPWQKMINDVLPLVCLVLVPTLLTLVGLYLYKKANAQKPGKKKAKDKKSKKK